MEELCNLIKFFLKESEPKNAYRKARFIVPGSNIPKKLLNHGSIAKNPPKNQFLIDHGPIFKKEL